MFSWQSLAECFFALTFTCHLVDVDILFIQDGFPTAQHDASGCGTHSHSAGPCMGQQ